MGFFKTYLVVFCVLLLNVISAEAQMDKRHALYLMHNNETNRALNEYLQLSKAENALDFEILQKMALILLKNGAKDEDLEVQQLTMFGAGLAGSNSSIDILRSGLKSSNMQTQLIALNFIANLNDDLIDESLNSAMSSDFLPTRLEAAYHMARRKHKNALGQIESLMTRLPPFIKPFFPQLFALLGTNDATKMLRRFLNDPNPDVRIESILNIANYSRDDLLPFIKKRFISSNIAEKEACAYAVGILKDSSSIDTLKKLSNSFAENVKIAALKALYILGDQEAKKGLEKEAANSVFAIATLGEIEGSQETLYKLTKSNNHLIKINAAIALLRRKDSRSVPVLKDILITNTKDLAIQPHATIGRTIISFKTVPASLHKVKEANVDLNLSLSIRESFLKQAVEIDEKSFLKLANMIFDKNQLDLVPVLITLLENIKSENVIDFLKDKAVSSNTPLIRDYCNLSLYRLKTEGLYEEYVKSWVIQQNQSKLLQLAPVKSKKDKQESIYSLTNEETSRLLVDMYTALASKQNQKDLLILVDAIKRTNPKNRYALAGLLIRATE